MNQGPPAPSSAVLGAGNFFFGGASPSGTSGTSHGSALAGHHVASSSGTGPRELFPPSSGGLQLEMKL